jgi:hypothetical protein
MRIDFQGNWRDIFQNWEALLFSYPDFTWNVINKFLNATTLDGYNPYRITLEGIDWECPDPDDPWGNIGYWSDHQIIYLLKLLELQEKFYPGTLKQGLKAPITSSATCPFEIKNYKEILKDPQDTIEFNREKNRIIMEEAKTRGNDARLVQTSSGDVYYVTPMEKLMVLLLAKLSNFIPDGGIWMNTQRPEWNDANNALVGYGISVVTLAYIRRYVQFLLDLLEEKEEFPVSKEVQQWYQDIYKTFLKFSDNLQSGFDGKTRKAMVDMLGDKSSQYRKQLYSKNPKGQSSQVMGSELKTFLNLIQQFVETSLKNSRREDGMFHAYNTLMISDDEMKIHYLYPMLEGQVAIISSGYLKAPEVNKLMEVMKNSPLYRDDQHSFILYPNRKMKSFFTKSIVKEDLLKQFGLQNMPEVIKDIFFEEDTEGLMHFNGDLNNAKGIAALADEKADKLNGIWTKGLEDLKKTLGGLYEELFNHREFTGRSGTFFAYEGLGSIYWHMVSKLMLALQEVELKTENESQRNEILKQYQFVRDGIGYKRSIESYGAFPYDPYSHTPIHAGARQPGMTGQVKEEVITRIAEMGITIKEGKINLNPQAIEVQEFFSDETSFTYYDASHESKNLKIAKDSMAFTYCTVPFIVSKTGRASVKLILSDGKEVSQETQALDSQWSGEIFSRSGKVSRVEIQF